MRNVITSTILGMGLLTGMAVGAYAQTDSVAALPPGAQAPKAPAAAVAPSAAYDGHAAGASNWTVQEKQTQPVQPSTAANGGPPAGASNWTVPEKQSGPVAPSPDYPGVRPN